MMEQTKIDFKVVPSVEENSPSFKLKITNLRKAAYATNRPDQSDYFHLKVGDLLCKGTSYTTIYEVVAIVREPISESQYNQWENKLRKYNNTISDTKAKSFIDEYKKNGNFGACRISVKPILRGEKEVAKPRIVKFLEIDNIRVFKWNGYQRTDIQAILRYRDAQIGKYTYTINSCVTKRQREQDLRKALSGIQDKRDAIIATRLVAEATTEIDQVEIAA
jgi:hypothetical protein